MDDGTANAYTAVLTEALEIGRADGRFAAAFEAAGQAEPSGDRCLGRSPGEFARLLWEGRPGTPPAAVELNAPLWYATGFREGLAAGTPVGRRGVRGLSHRRVLV